MSNGRGTHKELMVLGLVGDEGSMSGYDLHRIVRAHGELFTDLKKANIYHLLDRLATQGYFRMRTEGGARGRRGERLLYSLTAKGRGRFHELLELEVQRYGTIHTGIEVAVIFLSQLPRQKRLALLRKRQQSVWSHRERVATALGDVSSRGVLSKIAADHVLALVDAELEWVKRSIAAVEGARDVRGEH
ncbi:MAG: PadR family transcriptional regulator [Candidatus Eremiobacteraeota bacterium]|nr:PadR family transcriptional regulator [Candidatus Eremiobacteraeota bacterium]